jgi:hypothetical protein
MKGLKTVQRAAGERLAGGRPSVPQAFFTAAVIGTAVAAVVYRVLHND